MCDDPEDDLTALAPIAPRPQRRAQPPLDHRVDRLRLPPLTVLRLEPPQRRPHPPPPPPGRRLLRRASSRRGDQCPDAVDLPDVLVDPLAVEVGIGQQRPDPGAAGGLLQRRLEQDQVRGGAPAGHRPQHQMGAAVGHQHDLRILGVGRLLRTCPGPRPPLDVIPADVPRLHPGAIDGGRRDPPPADLPPHRLLQHGVEHRAGRGRLEQPGGGLLEGGVVGDGHQPDQRREAGVVGQVLGQPAVIEAREVLEHQAGHELGLGKLLGAELVPVRGESPAGRLVGGQEDPARGFAGSHIS
jgi:hypothetical protein